MIKMPRIKGWKRKSKYHLWWNSKSGSSISIDDMKSYWGVWYIPAERKINWRIDANKLLGKFRTKQDALKFAINWMKKHPNG